ncbi:MAG: AAA family ATPase [Chloroflexi bacterium]|nr:AAA family ATPase [Chloroflexota bacterium]
MKLVIIYGPEATGKLTIAKKLAEETGFRLFHNHVSIDVARTLFDFGDPEFSALTWDVRILVFEYAAKANIPGLVFTWAYSHPDFLPYLQRIREVMDKYQGEIYYVFVTCSVEELKRRVLQADRNQTGKINSVEALERQLQKKNHQVIPDTETLVIDNTALSPAEVV